MIFIVLGLPLIFDGFKFGGRLMKSDKHSNMFVASLCTLTVNICDSTLDNDHYRAKLDC